MKCQTRQSENNNKFRQDDVSVMDLLLCRCLLERNATKERRLLESTQDSSFSFTRGKFDKHNRIYQTLTGDRQETVQGNETSVIITLSVYNISVTTVIETRECKHLLYRISFSFLEKQTYRPQSVAVEVYHSSFDDMVSTRITLNKRG